MSDGFSAVAEFVEDEMGFATSYYNEPYLRRRVMARIRRTDADDYEAYLSLLRCDRDERTALLDSLSINVTGFFRNPEVWDSISAILAERANASETISVWSAGCADGREPYSLAMVACANPSIEERAVEILATDRDERSLSHARRGIYRESPTTDLAEELSFLEEFSRYVSVDGDRFSISERVRDLVAFERHDLITDPPKTGFDLVCCRNLLIYLDAESKERVIATLTASLEPGGYLVIGQAETLPIPTRDRYDVVDSSYRIFRFTG